MKFHVQGTAYEFPELQECTTKELRAVKEHAHMGLRKLMEGFYEMDPDAITAVVFIAKQRAGEKVVWEDLDELRPLQDIDWPEWETTEGEGQDPTPPESTGSGTSRTRGSKTTSASSRTTSTSDPEK